MTRKVDRLWKQEECFWQQRSRVKWLREGYANIMFFHQSTLQWCKRNKVLKIKEEDRSWEENLGRVRKFVDDYFINHFTSVGKMDWGQS